jgi:putative phosphoesterase
MLIGLLSDTHDRLDAMIAAMRVLRAAGAEYFLHGGDVGTEQIIDALAGENAAFVWGNNDYDRRTLSRYAFSVGARCLDDFGEITLDGKHFALTHGDDQRRIKQVLAQQHHDYLITGHTHVKSDQRVGRIRWINPGALHRAREKTVGLLETKDDTLRYLTVDGI